MQFHVRALSASNQLCELTIEAEDEAGVHKQLAARSLIASSVNRVPLHAIARKHTDFSLRLFSEELLALTRAGLSIVECLEALLDNEKTPTRRQVIEQLLEALHNGQRFSSALAAQGSRFPPLYIGLLRAAEGSSDIQRALTRYIDYQQRIDTVRARLVSAAIYPAILLAAGGAVSLFLMLYVVPRFAEVYRGAGRSLPALSQALLDIGSFTARHQGEVLAVLVLTIVLLCAPPVRVVMGRALAGLPQHLPVFGDHLLLYHLTRLWLTLAMLLDGGMPLVTALQEVRSIVPPGLQPQLDAVAAQVQSGQRLSDAMEHEGLATPVALSLLRAGERSGALARMLEEAAAFHEATLARWVDRFTRSAEPLLMAAIGLVVGGIVVLLYMPVFDLAGSLH